MFGNNPISQEILNQISNEEFLKELFLTPDGTLFLDPVREATAEEFWLYHQKSVYLPGSLYQNTHGESFRTVGTPLNRAQQFRLMKNQTVISPTNPAGCSLTSKRAGIPSGSSLLAFFRYRGKTVLIIAGDAVNRRSYTVIIPSATESDDFLFTQFKKTLHLCDPSLAAHIDDWLYEAEAKIAYPRHHAHKEG